MNKLTAKEHILNHLGEDDKLIGFFTAQGPFPIWWVLLLGPLGVFFLKTYYVSVTKNGINFHKLSFMGKFKDDGDFFKFDEIESVEIKNGIMQKPIIFMLKNGVKIKIKAQSTGLSKAATLNEETQEFILSNIL